MSTLIYLNNASEIHGYGLWIISNNKPTIENFLYNEIVPLCNEQDCDYFIQSLNLYDNMVSSCFVEFMCGNNLNKMLDVITIFNSRYGKNYYGGEVLMDIPRTELLKSLQLF